MYFYETLLRGKYQANNRIIDYSALYFNRLHKNTQYLKDNEQIKTTHKHSITHYLSGLKY